MATFFINTVIHSMIAIATIVALVAVFGTTKKDVLALAKRIGIGFIVYHSDSQKYFYCLTRKDALEWLGSTYADAVMFSNWTCQALAKTKVTVLNVKLQIF
jgi:hypothetical protein